MSRGTDFAAAITFSQLASVEKSVIVLRLIMLCSDVGVVSEVCSEFSPSTHLEILMVERTTSWQVPPHVSFRLGARMIETHRDYSFFREEITLVLPCRGFQGQAASV